MTDQQRNHRMPGQSSRDVGIRCRRRCQKDAEQFLAPAVGLAGHVNDGNNGSLFAVFISLDRVTDLLGQVPSLLQSDLSLARTGKAIVRVRHDGKESNPFLLKRRIGDQDRWYAWYMLRLFSGEGFKPNPATRADSLFVHKFSPFDQRLRTSLLSS